MGNGGPPGIFAKGGSGLWFLLDTILSFTYDTRAWPQVCALDVDSSTETIAFPSSVKPRG
jgi:hypothetical protein